MGTDAPARLHGGGVDDYMRGRTSDCLVCVPMEDVEFDTMHPRLMHQIGGHNERHGLGGPRKLCRGRNNKLTVWTMTSEEVN